MLLTAIPIGSLGPLNKGGINHRPRGGVIFAHDPSFLGDLELCVGVSRSGPKGADGDRECVIRREKVVSNLR